MVNETFRGSPLKVRTDRVGGGQRCYRREEGASRGPSTQTSEGAGMPGPAAIEVAPYEGNISARCPRCGPAAEVAEDAVL